MYPEKNEQYMVISDLNRFCCNFWPIKLASNCLKELSGFQLCLATHAFWQKWSGSDIWVWFLYEKWFAITSLALIASSSLYCMSTVHKLTNVSGPSHGYRYLFFSSVLRCGFPDQITIIQRGKENHHSKPSKRHRFQVLPFVHMVFSFNSTSRKVSSTV